MLNVKIWQNNMVNFIWPKFYSISLLQTWSFSKTPFEWNQQLSSLVYKGWTANPPVWIRYRWLEDFNHYLWLSSAEFISSECSQWSKRARFSPCGHENSQMIAIYGILLRPKLVQPSRLQVRITNHSRCSKVLNAVYLNTVKRGSVREAKTYRWFEHSFRCRHSASILSLDFSFWLVFDLGLILWITRLIQW